MIAGKEQKVRFFTMDLPHSDACFVKAYPGETSEAFCDGHNAAFAFFGGVPRSILCDNSKLAVARILGDGKRQRTRVFAELQSHYLFQDRFGRPRKGNDKGKVEGLTLVSSNLPFDEWTEVFGSERLTGALLDRLTHHLHILEMNGESYRLNQSRKQQDSTAD